MRMVDKREICYIISSKMNYSKLNEMRDDNLEHEH